MIALLNYLPAIIIIATIFLTIRAVNAQNTKRAGYTVAVGFIATMVVLALTPSYMPKGRVPGNTVPPFEASNAEIEDRLRAPKPHEEHLKRLEEKTDWKRKIEETKAAEAEEE